MQGAHEWFVRVTITIGYARVTVTIGCIDYRRIVTSLYHNEDKYKGKFIDGTFFNVDFSCWTSYNHVFANRHSSTLDICYKTLCSLK
jgi:hypothetical protein